MLRRLLRKHAWPFYRYYDNLLRLPPRAVAWRIYKRQIMERLWARRAARGIVTSWSPAQLHREFGGDPLDIARDWLASGRGFFDRPTPAAIAQRVVQLCPDHARRTIDRADAFLAGRFRLLEAKPEVTLPDRLHPDWTADPLNDIEWPHALSRFRKFARCLSRASLYTGDWKYADYLLCLMDDWTRRLPRGVPMAWTSMEISLRGLEWIAALHLLRGSPVLTAERLVPLWASFIEQIEHLRALPEIELSDNHLIYNLGSIAIAATAWPMLPRASAWRDWAWPHFMHELRRQHRPDGFNVEQSTHYFAQVARIYAEAWHWESLAGRGNPELERWIRLFLDVTAGLLRPDGTLPLISDAFTSFFEDSASDDARTLLAWGGVAFDRPDWRRAAGCLTEEAVWLLGDRADAFNAAPPPPSPFKGEGRGEGLPAPSPFKGEGGGEGDDRGSTLFLRDSGYYIARRDESYLIVDAGPLGFPAVPAHGHADILSFEFWHRGRPIIVDPGTYEYEPGEWAYYFRRTRAHATITIDGLDQATQWGFARWVDLPRVNVDAVAWENGRFTLDAWHGGYERLAHPVRHRRQITWESPDVLLIEDELTGRGRHTLEQTFPLAPSVTCEMGKDLSATLRPPNGAPLRIACAESPLGTTLHLPRGQKEPLIWGWSAANYGVCEPATVVVFRTECDLPARFVTRIECTPQS